MEPNEEENTQENTGGTEAAAQRKNRSVRKSVANFVENVKNVFKGKTKSLFALKVKLVLYISIAILVFLALIIEGNAEETTNIATSTTASVYENSTTKSAEMYNSTGSLILSTDAELDEMATNYLKKLEGTNEGYFNALSTKYSGKESSTVANKVAHITSNFEADETKEVDVITDTSASVSGEASPKDEKTIYKHILSTEKYNFNNIIWRSYVKSGSGLTTSNISFVVDSDSKLKYPASDLNATNSADLDLEFFITKVRPYLQSWYIPFDIMIGTQDAQDTANLNADLAYEILTSAYHEIVLDRYKIENLERTTNYLVYDKTTTTTTTTRTCADYKYTNVAISRKAGDACNKDDATKLCKDAVDTYNKLRAKGEACTDKDAASDCKSRKTEYTTTARKAGDKCNRNDFQSGKCKDEKMSYIDAVTGEFIRCVPNKMTGECTFGTLKEDQPAVAKCTDADYRNKKHGCTYGILKSNKISSVDCTDADYANKRNGCTYGTLKNDITENVTETKTYCIDTTPKADVKVEKDIRESKVNGTKDTDKLTYSWSYVISMAKMLDKVISNGYIFEAYYEYSLDNYNKYINKSDVTYENMTVEEYRESEKTNSQADEFSVEDSDYNVVEDPTIDNSNSTWNQSYIVDSIPTGGVKQEKTVKSKIVKKVVEVTKVGKEYKDTYSWSDTLQFDESKSGIYNMDSVKDVTGDDLTYDDEKYYKDIYDSKELNLIDLMNSDNNIYENYMDEGSTSSSTTNIGIRKSALDISYNVLKKDLKSLAESYPLSGLMYGNSLDILEGLNLASIVAAGSVNEALSNLAESYLGNDLTTMMTVADVSPKIFGRADWCAYFASYCMRKIEKETGVTIPIPTYASCTTCWKTYHNKVGFYDVQEWVNQNQVYEYVNTNPANIAPLDQIQQGDIILFSWIDDSRGDRDHTAIVKEVVKDENGKVTDIITIDGNIGGKNNAPPGKEDYYNYSKVELQHHYDDGSWNGIDSIASFISLSTVLHEYEQTGVWGEVSDGE